MPKCVNHDGHDRIIYHEMKKENRFILLHRNNVVSLHKIYGNFFKFLFKIPHVFETVLKLEYEV